MTGLPAALSAFAFASTARVADSLIAAMRREMRRSAGGVADGADSEGDGGHASIVSKMALNFFKKKKKKNGRSIEI